MSKTEEIDSLDPDIFFKGLDYCGETFHSWFKLLANYYDLHVSSISQLYRDFKLLHGTGDTERDNKEYFINLRSCFDKIIEIEREEARRKRNPSFHIHKLIDRLLKNPIFTVIMFLVDIILFYWLFIIR